MAIFQMQKTKANGIYKSVLEAFSSFGKSWKPDIQNTRKEITTTISTSRTSKSQIVIVESKLLLVSSLFQEEHCEGILNKGLV